jgi:hypothetical protein
MYYARIVCCENIVSYKAKTNHVNFDVCYDKKINFSVNIETTIK